MTNEEIREIYASAPVSKEVFEVIELSASWFSKLLAEGAALWAVPAFKQETRHCGYAAAEWVEL